MSNREANEDCLDQLEMRAADLDEASETRHDEAADAELEREFGCDGRGEPPANLVLVASDASFGEEDADRKEAIDRRISALRAVVDADEPISVEALDHLKEMLDIRATHLGIDKENDGLM